MASKPELHIDVDAAGRDEHDMEIEDDDMYSDESSAEGEIDPDIDFSVMYALHTFVATVDGQASVVKGDSMVLLDDSNSYWWLVNVLKADEVGYIPAENIETPNDRLARLNKMRNVEIAASTAEEKNLGRLKLRNIPSEAGHGGRPHSTISSAEADPNRRGVKFGEPTYVEHSGSDEDWSSEEETEDEEVEGEFESNGDLHDDAEDSEDDLNEDQGEPSRRVEVRSKGGPLQGEDGASYEEHAGMHGMMMEPDDGMSWEDDAVVDRSHDVLVGADQDASVASNYWDGSQPAASDSSHQSHRSSQQSHRSEESAASDASLSQLTVGAPSPAPDGTATSLASPFGGESSRILLPSEQFIRGTSPVGLSSDLGHHTSPYGDDAYTASSQQSLSSYAREQLLDQALEHPEETRRISATPAVARRAPLQSFMTGEAFEVDEPPAAMPRNFSSSSLRSDGGDSLDSGRKESFDRASPGQSKKTRRSDSDDDKGKKKAAGVFGSLFKKKGEKRGSRSPGGGPEGESNARSSDEESSIRPQSAVPSSPIGPRPGSSTSSDEQPKPSFASPPPTIGQLPGPASPSVSPHALRLQQEDQKVQAAYQRYLTQTTSRASAELAPASLSYGTQAAATVAQSSAAQRIARASIQGNRPASLLISNSNLSPGRNVESDATGGASGSFAVLRVFAGEAIESDATFKTVLLKDTTTTAELLRQAMQRFGLGLGRDEALQEYSLTVKGFDGDETVLGHDGHPLVVFNAMTRDDAVHAPLIRQTSIGSINSVASNLTMHPAISRLGDWSDDSVVKLYIHRNLGPSTVSSATVSPRAPAVDALAKEPLSPYSYQGSAGRFTLQIIIQPGDLPDGMGFDPASEALVVARRRSTQVAPSASSSALSSPSLSQTERKRLFLLPANTTVAEAIETSFDRFGIAEGVVDGGDIVEDKLSNRKSITRVRYGLAVRKGSEERLLQPSTKLLDVYDTPPVFRALPGPTDSASRRRSREIPEARVEDLGAFDPVFILRKALPRETPSNSGSRRRSRLSASLNPDGVGLYRRNSLQAAKDHSRRVSASSEVSRTSSTQSLSGPEGEDSHHGSSGSEQTVTRETDPPSTRGQATSQQTRAASSQQPGAALDDSYSPVAVINRTNSSTSNRSRISALNGNRLHTPATATIHADSSLQTSPSPASPLAIASRDVSNGDDLRGSAGGQAAGPLVTRDDFGVSSLLAVIRARAHLAGIAYSRRKSSAATAGGLPAVAKPDAVDLMLFGKPLADGGPGWEGKRGLVELQGRLDDFDKELDRLFDAVGDLALRERTAAAADLVQRP